MRKSKIFVRRKLGTWVDECTLDSAVLICRYNLEWEKDKAVPGEVNVVLGCWVKEKVRGKFLRFNLFCVGEHNLLGPFKLSLD